MNEIHTSTLNLMGGTWRKIAARATRQSMIYLVLSAPTLFYISEVRPEALPFLLISLIGAVHFNALWTTKNRDRTEEAAQSVEELSEEVGVRRVVTIFLIVGVSMMTVIIGGGGFAGYLLSAYSPLLGLAVATAASVIDNQLGEWHPLLAPSGVAGFVVLKLYLTIEAVVMETQLDIDAVAVTKNMRF